MESSQFSSFLQELFIHNESIALPGIGKLVKRKISASFSADGASMLPPSTRIVPQLDPAQEDTGNLVDLFARESGKDLSEAARVFQDLAHDFREHYEKDGTSVLPGLGTVKKSDTGEPEFDLLPDADLLPDEFALEAIPLEAHAPLQAQMVGGTSKQPDQPAGLPVRSPGPPSGEKPAPAPKVIIQKQGANRTVIWVTAMVLIVVLLIAAAIIFREAMEPLMQKMLYSQEELDILQKWTAR